LTCSCRPARDSLYLQIGVSENDAEEQGLSQLDTELTVTDAGRQPAGTRSSSGGAIMGGAGAPGRDPYTVRSSGAPTGTGLPVSIGAGNKPSGPARFTIADED